MEIEIQGSKEQQYKVKIKDGQTTINWMGINETQLAKLLLKYFNE